MDYNTNVYTSGPLAAVYQAQDQSAKAGAADLQNLIKGMSLPKEQVEMQTYQHLLDDPNYVKANAQFQMAATQAKLGDEEKKVAVNGLDRLLIQLQANPDPASQQQLILKSFQEKGVDPTSPMAQAILADPFGKTKEARDKLMSTFAQTPQHVGEMEKQQLIGQQHMDVAKYNKQAQLEAARIRGEGGGGGSAVTKARNKILTGSPQNVLNYAGAALKTGIDPLTKQPIDEYDRQIFQAYYDEAQATLSSKGGGGIEVTDQGVKIQPRGVRQVPGQTSSNDFSGTASAFAPTSDPLGIR